MTLITHTHPSRLRKFWSLPQVLFGEKVLCQTVTRVHSRFGDRCFAAAGPRIWNNLPASLRDQEVSCTAFKRQQTENIHVSAGLQRIVTFLIIAPYKYYYLITNLLTYLLTYYLLTYQAKYLIFSLILLHAKLVLCLVVLKACVPKLCVLLYSVVLSCVAACLMCVIVASCGLST